MELAPKHPMNPKLSEARQICSGERPAQGDRGSCEFLHLGWKSLQGVRVYGFKVRGIPKADGVLNAFNPLIVPTISDPLPTEPNSPLN